MIEDQPKEVQDLCFLIGYADEIQRRFREGNSLENVSELAILLKTFAAEGKKRKAPEFFIRELVSNSLKLWAKLTFNALVEDISPNDTVLAVDAIAELGCLMGSWLNQEQNKPASEEAAQYRCSWPILADSLSGASSAPQALGAKTLNRKVGRKAVSRKVLANRLVQIACIEFQALRNQLPPAMRDALSQAGVPSLNLRIAALPDLTKSTADKWGALAFEYFNNIYDGKIEDVPQIRQLGVHKVKHATNRAGKVIAERANCQAGIKQRLQQAFEFRAPEADENHHYSEE